MTLINLSDLIEDRPSVIPEGVIPYFDGCKWGLFDLGTLTGERAPCSAVQACIDDVFIASIMSSGNGTITFNPDGTVDVLANQVIALANPSIDCSTGEFSIGNEVIDLSCIADLYSFNFTNGNHTIQVSNGTSIFVRGFDGLRFNTWANELHIGLPTGAEPGQVLTWNGAGAYRTNGCETCCEFIQDCMSGTVAILQNQINLLSNIVGGGSPAAGLQSVVGGDYISIDNTDPLNPIVSYSGVNKSQITVEITPAQLIGYTTPIEMIPAPGPGKILYVGFWFCEIIMDTTPYNSGTYRFNLTNQTGNLDALAVGNITPTSDFHGNSILAGPALPNTPLLMTLVNIPTVGDSIVKFTFDYQIIDI